MHRKCILLANDFNKHEIIIHTLRKGLKLWPKIIIKQSINVICAFYQHVNMFERITNDFLNPFLSFEINHHGNFKFRAPSLIFAVSPEIDN